MYTLKITDENTVVTTVKESIVERSNYVDKIQIVTSKMYREQIDMSDTTVYMKYKLPVSDKIKMTQLIINNLEYEQNYIQYNKLFDVPIVNLIGTLTVPVKISSLDDGIYKVKGQCIIGGNNTTVQSSADDVLYLVSHDADTSSTTITKMQGKSITLYFIQQDGEYTTDRYITESWINEQNFASADSVKEYVSNIIEETVLDVLDEHIDAALDRKLGGIDSEDLTNIFQGGN